MTQVKIIGGGLAGCEAAWQLAERNIRVDLYEMRPEKCTPAHQTQGLAELVCSNSFRSDDKLSNAVGILHEELRICGSLIMKAADEHKVPAGSALAVDRNLFSARVTNCIRNHQNINVIQKEVINIPDDWENIIIATGPLTSEALSEFILKKSSDDSLFFFDAIAPIVYTDSIDMSAAWFQSRYNKVGPSGSLNDYINCPLNEEQYHQFVDELIEADKASFNEWEKDTPYFDSCLPIEVIARSGPQTLRHGPMKPFGLNNPHKDGNEPYAVLQLRQDDISGQLYNMVGFQTKIKYGHQTDIFRKIPGLCDARFARLGGIHRNTYINSPKLLSSDLSLISDQRIKFAGQITGVEGYVESASTGLLSGLLMYNKLKVREQRPPPKTTAMGSLISYITRKDHVKDFQPMNINFGLFESMDIRDIRKKPKRIRDMEKKIRISQRAESDLNKWLNSSFV